MFPDFLIIDFDSTFISKESLDELAYYALQRSQADISVIEKIQKITDAGMNGEITFHESIDSRLQLMKANKSDVIEVSNRLKDHITSSFLRNKDFIHKHNKKIYFISGGFREMLLPVLNNFGISNNHIFGNEFTYDSDNDIVGFEKNNPLIDVSGKAKIVESLCLNGEIHAIGDGYNDYKLKVVGAASKFFAFTENVKRANVCTLADMVLASFDDYIEILDD